MWILLICHQFSWQNFRNFFQCLQLIYKWQNFYVFTTVISFWCVRCTKDRIISDIYYRRFGGQVVSALDSCPKALGSIPVRWHPGYLYLTSAVTLCGKVTVKVCRSLDGMLSFLVLCAGRVTPCGRLKITVHKNLAPCNGFITPKNYLGIRGCSLSSNKWCISIKL